MGRPWDIPPDWPPPPPEALAISERLVDALRAEMAEAGGDIPFSRFMERALYAPGLGYYSAGSRKFGAEGDFVTAPEVSDLFSRCLARTVADLLDALDGGEVIELGAGSGRMAAVLLRALDRAGRLPVRYRILEPSAALRERQRQALALEVPDLLDRVEWLEAPPDEPCEAVVIGNEVLDALPVECLGWHQGRVEQARVGWGGEGFELCWRPAQGDWVATVAAIAREQGWPEGYRTEWRPMLPAWLRAIAAPVARGACLFIDYGHPRREYFHPQRSGGTLMCHYRHRAHPDPLLLPGLQDITAYVDFTALAEAGEAAGLTPAACVTQTQLLMDAGIDACFAEAQTGDPVQDLALAQQVKTLMLPGEMGERFQAMLLLRGELPLPRGFRSGDLRWRL